MFDPGLLLQALDSSPRGRSLRGREIQVPGYLQPSQEDILLSLIHRLVRYHPYPKTRFQIGLNSAVFGPCFGMGVV